MEKTTIKNFVFSILSEMFKKGYVIELTDEFMTIKYINKSNMKIIKMHYRKDTVSEALMGALFTGRIVAS